MTFIITNCMNCLDVILLLLVSTIVIINCIDSEKMGSSILFTTLCEVLIPCILMYMYTIFGIAPDTVVLVP